METMIDLAEVAGDLLGVNSSAKDNGDNDGDTDENYGLPFVALSEFCINVLSSPICGDAGAKVGGRSSKLICDCVKSLCSGGMALHVQLYINSGIFQGSNISNARSYFGPEYMHEEGVDAHVNIYESDLDEVNSDEDGDGIGVLTLAANVADLNLSNDVNSNGGGERSDYDDEKNTNQSNNYEE